jgi:hypothetical protein
MMTNVDPVFLLDKVPSWVPDLSPGQEQMPGLTSSQLPTALRLGNTVTTDKSTIIENFKKHFSPGYLNPGNYQSSTLAMSFTK